MAGWWVNDIQNFVTSVEKIFATYKEEPKVIPPRTGGIHEKLKGDVEFKNVSYSADDEDIVKDISFKVHAGQTVGIIGSTGAGKSTLMNLLCRFYDATSGQVLVDGRDVKDLDLYNLRDNIGMAMQDVFLFSDTIEGNIAYGRPECSFEDVKHAAIMADANHFINAMPDKYDTIVGERGVGLSGGQKQRISLARALLKDPSILILDDTTSAVDMETESYIQKQLKSIQNKCTVFVIAYRISSIKDSDLILVMDNGRIIEHGTHDELVEKGGYYAKAFHNQYGEIPYEMLEEQKQMKKGGN
jgi:ATP-binding cassette subfamily B protein